MFGQIRVFSTCPQSKDHPLDVYLQQVLQVSQWSDAANCDGMLIYADNSIIDPWLVAQIVVQTTRRLAPLVAVQPIYMHPYSVAKMVSSLSFLYQRPIWLNMIAGGFRNDLLALGDPTEHDQRYTRLIEYTDIIQQLLTGKKVSYQGQYYRIENLSLTPVFPDLQPRITMAGSSPASRAAAITLNAIAVEYPEATPQDIAPIPNELGIRVGIIAHASADKAWEIARQRFPVNRRGQVQQAMAMQVSDSSWQKTLGVQAKDRGDAETTYWMHPFKNYHTFCPYLVGDYQTVGAELGRYFASGYRTVILDIPRDRDDLSHTIEAFRCAGAFA